MNNGTYDMSASPLGMAAGLFYYLFMVVAYLFVAYTQYRIAQKCGAKQTAWWAFVPIMNILLLCQMARRPLWWALLLIVPIVGLAVWLIMSVEAAKNSGHSQWWGLAMIVPFLNVVALIVMAFTGDTPQESHPAFANSEHHQQRTRLNVG